MSHRSHCVQCVAARLAGMIESSGKEEMERFLGVVPTWLAVFAFALPAWGQGHEFIQGGEAVSGEAIVKFRPNRNISVEQVRQRYRLNQVHHLGGDGIVRVVSPDKSAADLVAELSADSDVLYAEPNYILHAIAVPNDPGFNLLWGLQNTGQNGGAPGADIEAVSAWDISTGSRLNVVGVVDTGIDATHPDLVSNLWSAPGAFTISFGPRQSVTCPAGSHGFDAIKSTCTPTDQNGHGTHVSGTIGAAGNNSAGVTGVNWQASIMALRFLDSKGSGTTAGAIAAIEFAIQAKIKGVANVRVLSNSWGGGGFSQSLLDEINRANANDILFVVAAGNSAANLDGSTSFPAGYRSPNVVVVAATDANDALATFSSYGASTVDLGAPGVNIASTWPGNQYAYLSGTSMATPHVSGAAALLLAACTLNTAGLRSALVNNAEAIPALQNKTITGGRLNVNRAIRACSSGTPTPGFSLTVSPASQTVTAGSSGTSAVTVAASGGFSGNVSLSAIGLPAGVTASFSPNPVGPAGPSTMTLTASATAPAGATTFSVRGVSGALSATTSVTVTVKAAPSFSLSASPSSLSVRAGRSASSNVSVIGSGGFSGTVTLQVAGLPSGATAVFTPASLQAGRSSTLQIGTQATTPTGRYTATVTGTSGTLVKSVQITLTVTR